MLYSAYLAIARYAWCYWCTHARLENSFRYVTTLRNMYTDHLVYKREMFIATVIVIYVLPVIAEVL